ncbi:hypothetical protein FY133_18395 [Agrobacterium tumefaciens]|uniref:hypothetical protein n=1 Tax=Agrobacterium tumefaciens TaxID=358 RepID=UPI0021D01F2F|nr:hypothetical protein [Agrobacterium tumefaciens]UXS11606.1 hypothetical protein FY155_18315 [Agrobacterium tumefaciens]UXS18972.1 hypothetical protein FY154_18310 [Agrobacterium tumefaciens]UXT67611.1 hypothetical protein FY133_18395 [Agrobacterium tumefaciens]
MRHPYPMLSRGTVVIACDILNGIKTNAEIESLIIEHGLEEHVPYGGSIAKTVLSLKKFAAQNPNHEVETDFGPKPLSRFLVEKAIELVGWKERESGLWEKLDRYLQLDGFSLDTETTDYWGNERIVIKGLVTSFPESAELTSTVNELDALLSKHGFIVSSRHLSSARENIAQADWEAANSQCRTFLEAVTDGIADKLFTAEAESKLSGLQKRQLLAEKGFLSTEKHEFSDGNKQAYLPGLAKLLHPDGSHPGISNQDDAMFRLQTVIVTTRWLLKRFDQAKN